MSRVKGAFASLEVKGSIGDTFTFCTWKGIQIVKKKPFPSNPQTTDQTSNRNQHKSAVEGWHDTKLDKFDKQAWDLRALLGKKPMSGFNSYISVYRLAGLSNTWLQLYNMNFVAAGAQVSARITPDADCDITFAIIRGPNAGYNETLGANTGVEEAFSAIDISSKDVCVFTADDGGGITGESGYHYAVID